MTHLQIAVVLSHLLIEALAEFALRRLAEVYLGNAKSVASSTMRFAERSELPISGIFRELLLVFQLAPGVRRYDNMGNGSIYPNVLN